MSPFSEWVMNNIHLSLFLNILCSLIYALIPLQPDQCLPGQGAVSHDLCLLKLILLGLSNQNVLLNGEKHLGHFWNGPFLSERPKSLIEVSALGSLHQPSDHESAFQRFIDWLIDLREFRVQIRGSLRNWVKILKTSSGKGFRPDHSVEPVGSFFQA